MNKPIQLAFAALALCAAQQCSAALPLSFPVARDWLYERSDKLKASEEQVQSKRETQKSLETLGGPTVTLQAMQIAGQKKIDIDKSIPNLWLAPRFQSSFPDLSQSECTKKCP